MHKHLKPGPASWRTLQRHGAALAFAGALAALTPQHAAAQDAGALVDKLIKKGVLTSQEGEDVRAEMMKDFTQTSAGKINLSQSVTKLKLYGDFRYRWQYEDRESQVANADHVSQRDRHRFRLTLAADVELADHFYAGFALQTGQLSDGALQTMENGFDDYNIFISKAFLGWKPAPWLDVTIGKVKNPFYTTDLVWDPDITPNGLFEQIAFHKMPIFDGAAGPSGKSVVEPPKSSPWELTLVAGQMIFDDNNEFNLDNDLSTDAYLFVEQLIATYKFNKDTSATIAPAFMSWTAADLSGLTRANAFTDAGDLTFAVPVQQTTVTGRDRVVYAYDGAGAITGATVTRREITAVQVSQPTVTASGLSTTTRVVDTRERVIASTALTAAQAAARAQASGVLTDVGVGTTGRTIQTDGDNVTVTTTSTTQTALAAVSGETRAMHILTAPGDISFKLGGLKSKIYWDAAYNLTGHERFSDIYQLRNFPRDYRGRDSLAWLVGLQLGEIKKKGDWQTYVNYRETGIASVDPNLNDGDFALGELNMRGFKAGVAFALSDAVVFSVVGYMAWNMDKNLVGGRATNAAQSSPPLGGAGVAESNAVNVVQVDLAVKF
jgi:hypothetical protein